jgi:CubicO group peptidase (beta-lactamase class C family)
MTPSQVRRTAAGLLCLSVALLLNSIPAAAAAEPPTDAEIAAILKKFIERDHWGVGMVVGILDEQGTRLISYGKLDNGESPQVNGDTLFEIGSITKTFTTLLLQDMVERGKMRLEDPVENYLPAAVKLPRWDSRKITLLDLATHTSGLPRDLSDDTEMSAARLYERLAHCHLTRPPGRKAEYSNLGLMLLGHVLVLKTGTNYEALVRERICRPLGMDSTWITPPAELRARLATSHNQENRAAGGDLADRLAPLPGSGAIRSSVNDLLKYVAANLGLKPSPLTALMETTHAVRVPRGFEDADVALPWWIRHRDGADLITHGGTTWGHEAFIGFDKQARRGVVVLANREDRFGQAVQPLGMYLLHPPSEQPAAVKVAPEILDSYAGLYELPDVPGALVTLRRRDGRLVLQLLNYAAGPEWSPISSTEFAQPWDSNPRMKLTRSAGGRVTAVFTRPGGVTRRAWRVSDRVPESLFLPMSQPLAAGECAPRQGSDLQGTWDVTARLWYWPFVSRRGKLSVAEPSPGVFRAEFDFPQLNASKMPVSIIYEPPDVQLIARSGAGLFKGRINADHTTMTGHYIIGHFSVGTTVRRVER